MAVVPLCHNWSLCKMSRPTKPLPAEHYSGRHGAAHHGHRALTRCARCAARVCVVGVRGGWLRRARRLPCRRACPPLRGGGSHAAACGFGLSVRAVLFVVCAARSVACPLSCPPLRGGGGCAARAWCVSNAPVKYNGGYNYNAQGKNLIVSVLFGSTNQGRYGTQ